MVRYIRSSADARTASIDKAKRYMKAISHDIGVLNQIEDPSDLDTAEFRSARLDKFIQSNMEKGEKSFEEIIEDFIDYEINLYMTAKDDYKRSIQYAKDAEEVIDQINSYLKPDYKFTKVGDTFFVEPEGSIVRLCDLVKEAIYGDYNGTGRGGSWTTWNLRSKNGVRVDVSREMSENHGKWTVQVV